MPGREAEQSPPSAGILWERASGVAGVARGLGVCGGGVHAVEVRNRRLMFEHPYYYSVAPALRRERRGAASASTRDNMADSSLPL